jgi:thiamine biosynthesis lipoprotein
MPLRKSKTKPKPEPAEPETHAHFQFEAIGTVWAIAIFEPITDQQAVKLEAAVRQRIAQFDRHYSRFRDDSLVAQMAYAPGTYTLPADARPLFDLYEAAYDLTDGAVTPLIGQVLSDAGYDAQYSLKPGKLQPPPRWEDVLQYAYPTLTMRQPALLDLGAAGKGYAVDLVVAVLRDHGVQAYCVDAGGDMTYHNTIATPLRVGLEHPTEPGQAIGVCALAPGKSLCASAGNRRAWAGFHHIMDPHTLQPSEKVRAMWVVADSTILADMLTTCLFFVSPRQLARYTFEYALVRQDFSLEHSAHFPAHFFTAKEQV